ncbi:DUF6443 domain-containing protein [Mucilaginibacter sp. RS28]|uniref:DUF6443 domain-containing protein n=1 Tax=Mucilaginibacter straminoryzae TaxID=2932774 RepID=A0A9X1X119_9SPHI|nr:DUF6443 domain-containing protein [Mucilaginibacter straminoryzae]MCJ8208811.1 DUF6443 domain-containing protein [Mucilaginibacter straminoryzae]
MKPITKKIKQLTGLLIAAALMVTSKTLQAQTLVTGPMSGTYTNGIYYNTSGIVIQPNTTIAPGPGQSVQIYVSNISCLPLALNLSNTQNYIVTSIPRTAGYNPGTSGYTTCQLMQTVQYFDGLGRPLQTVQVKGSPKADKDLVQPFAYDQFGRETRKYLPYPSVSADGSYKADALNTGAGVQQFYNPNGQASGQQNTNGVANIPNPYAETGFEPSPLNRPVEQGAPGSDWVIGQHTVKTEYSTNAASGSYAVRLFSVDASGNVINPNNANYNAGELYLTITKDENWSSANGLNGQVHEYKDKEGHVVLKRTFNHNPATGQDETLSTYYVYNDLGNLAYVLPPKANPDNGIPAATLLDNLCYQYRYDERNRLTQKKLPGKGWEYMVYNKLDQVVLTQDANQGVNNQWTVTKYDALGRVILTGLWNAGSPIPLSTLQSNIYAGVQYDSRDVNNSTTGYNISSYPAVSKILAINYYDRYDGIPNLPAAYNQQSAYPANVTGLLTATRTAVINTITNANPDYLWTANYYDDKGRNVTTYAQHYKGGIVDANNYDVITSTYDFTSEVVATNRRHYTNAGTAPQLTIANTYMYDHMGRKTQTWEQINNGTNVLLSQLDYNEIGQLKTKHLHSTNSGSSFLQDVNYTYNERGWTRTMNTSGNLFNLDLRYNTPDAGITPQFNGNIAQLLYVGQHSGSKAFSYTYDALNRLTNAQSTDNSLNEALTYDPIGNITHLTRSGSRSADLGYGYNGNQLSTVSNNSSAYRSYNYDANGNATSDGGITGNKGITYNLLNLPQAVTQNNTTIATYAYDASGQKLRNTGSDGSWDYVNGITYHNNAIEYVQTEEGRAIPANGYTYQYDLKDHLGNVRVSFYRNPNTGNVEVLQEDEYYAFGLRNRLYDNGNNNRKLYNGKEIQTDLADQYDYGTRFYDPVIARWTTLDPKAELGRRLSPYNYAFDDPMRFTDPDGMWPDWLDNAVAAVKSWLNSPASSSTQFGAQANLVSATGAAQVPLPQTNGDALMYNLGAGAIHMSASLPGSTKIPATVTPEAPEVSATTTSVSPAVESSSAIGNKTVLHHYTTEEGQNGILSSQKLNPSLKANNTKDARYGDGQYLSDIEPGSKTPAQLSKAFLNVPYQGKKFTHYVSIDVTGLEVKMGRDNVYVVPNTQPLPLKGRIVNSGSVSPLPIKNN